MTVMCLEGRGRHRVSGGRRHASSPCCSLVASCSASRRCPIDVGLLMWERRQVQNGADASSARTRARPAPGSLRPVRRRRRQTTRHAEHVQQRQRRQGLAGGFDSSIYPQRAVPRQVVTACRCAAPSTGALRRLPARPETLARSTPLRRGAHPDEAANGTGDPADLAHPDVAGGEATGTRSAPAPGQPGVRRAPRAASSSRSMSYCDWGTRRPHTASRARPSTRRRRTRGSITPYGYGTSRGP